MNTEIIKEIDVQSVMTKSSLPVGGYSVNPYVGCPHACKYCYASFMKRFTGAYRTVGCISGREELETDSQSAQI